MLNSDKNLIKLDCLNETEENTEEFAAKTFVGGTNYYWNEKRKYYRWDGSTKNDV